MNKLLEDAKEAGFDIEGDEVIESISGWIITNRMAKFAALQIPIGYKLMPIDEMPYISKEELCNKAWDLIKEKAIKDTAIYKVNIHTIRTLIDSIYEASMFSNKSDASTIPIQPTNTEEN